MKLRPSSTIACTSGRKYRSPLNARSRPRMISLMVTALMSTAVMSVAPWLSAFSTSRPPPAPTLSTWVYFRPSW